MKSTTLYFCFFMVRLCHQCEGTNIDRWARKKIDPYHYQVTKNAMFRRASVASAHPLASLVGAAIMEQGGNAMDAAIATQLALAVVYPGAGNLGGGGFLLARMSSGELVGLDYREAAPSKASRDMYLDQNGNPLANLSTKSRLASGIPGTVAGLFAALPYAKLPFAQLIQPAIDLADKGFVLSEKQVLSFNSEKENFLQSNHQPIPFVKEGRWRLGDTLVQKELAATLRRIQKDGARGFYAGETAQMIIAEMKKEMASSASKTYPITLPNCAIR